MSEQDLGTAGTECVSNVARYLRSLDLAERQLKLAVQTCSAANANAIPQNVKLFVWGDFSVGSHFLELNEEEAAEAGAVLLHSSTYLVAVAIDTAIEHVIPDRFQTADSRVQVASRVARFIRNAFAHDPFFPTWVIGKAHLRKKYVWQGVIELDATELHGQPVRREDYGGPLALLHFLQHVRALIESARYP